MITEGQINKYLIDSLELYKALEQANKKELATQVLALSSKMADLMLEVSGIRKNYVNYTICQTCGNKYTSWKNREFIIKTGECLGCDHVKSDTDYQLLLDEIGWQDD